MFLKSVYINKFKVLENINLEFNPNFTPTIFPLASLNGGGKSTFLQLIFILIYTSFSTDKEKLVYLKNLLKSSELLSSNKKLELFVKLVLEYNEKEYFIEYYLVNNNFADFNSYMIFQDLESKYLNGRFQRALDESKELKNIISENKNNLDNLEKRNTLSYYNRDLPFKRRLQRVVQQGDTQHRILFQKYEETERIQDVVFLLNDLIEYFEEKNFRLVNELEEYSLKKDFLFQKLKENSLSYIVDATKNTFLLYKSDMEEALLNKLSEKIFLVAPNTQVFSFLDEEAKKTLFLSENISKEELKIEEFYDYHVRNSKKFLNNFFTYEFASTTLIINSFKKARDKDFEDAVVSGNYGSNLTRLQTDLNKFLLNKTISVDKDLKRVIFKLNDSNKELNPEDLSHGELKKLGLFIWLKYKHLEDSIILMDEVENGLHPDWQYSIIKDLENWAPSNQLILATHSYEICDALTPSHISELNPKLLKENHD